MKKKILIAIDSLGGGGAEKVLVTLLENLSKEKYEITVFPTMADGVYSKKVKESVNNYIQIPFQKGRTKIFKLLSAKIIYKLFIKEKYDIEIAFLEGHAAKIIAASANKKSKKYCWIHIDLEKQNGPLDIQKYFNTIKQQRLAYKKFDKCFCVSDATREAFERKMHNNNAKTLYNPVDEINIIECSSEKIDNWKKKKFTIISVGRLTDQKGYDRLLRIHNQLIKDGYNYELLVLGQGEKQQELQKYIDDNNLADTVKLLGFQSNPYKYMAQADLFVCSSRAEGYSLVVAESLVLGVPVVSTFCSGPVELLNNGEYGLIVDNEEGALYQGLKKILNDKILYGHYKKQAKIRAKDFKIEQRIAEIEVIFDQES